MSSDFNSEYSDLKPDFNFYKKNVHFPLCIWDHKDLNPTEMALLGLIRGLDSLENDERGCFASNKWLAKTMHKKDPTYISKLISRLESLKLITVKIEKYTNVDKSGFKTIKTKRLIFYNYDIEKTKHRKSVIPEREAKNIEEENFISKRRFKFVSMPKKLWDNSELNWHEKKLFMEIFLRGGDHEDGCYVSNKYFAVICLKVSIVSVSQMISHLKKVGLVFCLDGEDGKGNIRILRCKNIFIKSDEKDISYNIKEKPKGGLKNNREDISYNIKEKPKGGLKKNPSILDPIIRIRYSKEYLEEQAKACWKGIVGGADAPASNPSSIILPSFSRKRKPNLKKRYPLMRGTFGYNFVRKWNEEGPGNTTKHNLAAKTKTLIQIKRYLNQLKAGRFFRDKEIDPGNNDQIKKGFERWKRESHKFTEQELMEGIENLHKLFTYGYWPDNKNILPRGLNTLLYNERTNKSWFLNVLAAAPRPNGQKNIKFAETYSLPNTELMEVLGLNRETIGAKIKDIDKAVCHIFDTYQRTIENNPSSFGLDDFQNEYQTPGQFLGGFIEWIRNQDWLDSIELRMFLPGSRVFQLWKENLEGDFKGYGDQIFKIY